jgi:ATP adenylyltransferase/5',5'''-P-1,P-4-tetraphosphate phosphorylase II
MHKHMQVIPYESMNADGLSSFVPVEENALRYIREHQVTDRLFTLPQFRKFKHVFCRLDEDMVSSCGESETQAELMSEKLEDYYHLCLEYLDNEEHSHDVSYNLLVFKNFMLIALRRVEGITEENRTVTVNSLGFAGTHAVKREEDLELWSKYSSIGILEQVSVPVEEADQ